MILVDSNQRQHKNPLKKSAEKCLGYILLFIIEKHPVSDY